VDGLSGLFLPKQKSGIGVGEMVLSSPGLKSVASEIKQAIQSLQESGGEVVFIVDQLELLLAAGGEHVTAVEITEMLLGFREVRSAWILLKELQLTIT
jgi:hypothetical protein